MKNAAWKTALLSGVLLLSACGVETLGTAATVGELKAEEAENAQRKREKIQETLNEIQAASRRHGDALEAAAAVRQTTRPPEEERSE